ncbi:MAG: YciI family protein [Paracoccaceae bacterium]
MFIILLRFSDNRDQAADHMEGHRSWLKKGFDDGVFLLAGSLPEVGGGVLARGETREAITARVDQDPFVTANVVTAEILAMDPARADDRLSFLLS